MLGEGTPRFYVRHGASTRALPDDQSFNVSKTRVEETWSLELRAAGKDPITVRQVVLSKSE